MTKQLLNITSAQQLQLTPRLQQSIHMLQLSTYDLIQELQTLLQSNLVLEISHDDGAESLMSENSEKTQCDEADDWQEIKMTSDTYQSSENDMLESEWYSPTQDDLREQLLWQLRLSGLSEVEVAIGEAIIDSINNDGYLCANLTDIRQAMKMIKQVVSLDQIEHVLKIIQTFSPVGVAARDLKETLLIQLREKYDSNTPYYALTKKLISSGLELMAKHHYAKLCQLYHIDQYELEQAIALIHQLNPRPGNVIAACDNIDNIIPDVIVREVGKRWRVVLNQKILPKFEFNNHYLSMIKDQSDNVGSFVNGHLQEARWLLKCFRNRNETLLKVATCIVEFQQAFMRQGTSAMRPLVLREVADQVGLHPSTVSRITTNKYIQTPQGTFELKYFFNSHVSTHYGSHCSSTAIQTYIKKMIEDESKTNPLSDQEISKKLQAQGLNVARRTVAKYRDLLEILPANQRRVICSNVSARGAKVTGEKVLRF